MERPVLDPQGEELGRGDAGEEDEGAVPRPRHTPRRGFGEGSREGDAIPRGGILEVREREDADFVLGEDGHVHGAPALPAEDDRGEAAAGRALVDQGPASGEGTRRGEAPWRIRSRPLRRQPRAGGGGRGISASGEMVASPVQRGEPPTPEKERHRRFEDDFVVSP